MAEKSTTERQPGRPPVEINLEDLERLLAMQATDKEIADWFGVTKQAISARKKSDPDFKAAYDRGRNKGKASLRRLMWEKAQGREGEIMRDDNNQICFDDKGKVMWRVPPFPPDTTMQIFLSKNLLGFADKQETDVTSKGKEIKQAPIFQVIDTETQDLLKRVQNGERTQPMETNTSIQS